MKFANPSLILIPILIAGGIWAISLTSSTPQKTAKEFLEVLQSGNLSRAVEFFDLNNCQCVAKGGWGSYLIYQSGHDPNLAFLVGHRFRIGELRLVPIQRKWKPALPGTQPESSIVNILLEFDPHEYSPLFLPLPLAYGSDMSWNDFKKFTSDPANGMGRGFTLRLRPSLKPGSIKTNLATIDPRARARFAALDGEPASAAQGQPATGAPPMDKESSAQDLLVKALKQQNSKYYAPRDAGKVLKDGVAVPFETLEKELPRLKSTILSVNFSRSGALHNWSIFRFAFMQPTFLDEHGKVFDLAPSRMTKPHYEP
jgi:hypothetical protein